MKKDWKPENTLSHVLQVIRCLLIVPFPESSLNDEAGKLFMESYEEYAKKAKFMTSLYANFEKDCEGLEENSVNTSPSARSHQIKTPLSAGHVNTIQATLTTKKNSVPATASAKEVDRKKKSLRRL